MFATKSSKLLLLVLGMTMLAAGPTFAQNGQGGNLPPPSDQLPLVGYTFVEPGGCGPKPALSGYIGPGGTSTAPGTKTRIVSVGTTFLQPQTGALPYGFWGNKLPPPSSPVLPSLFVAWASNYHVCFELNDPAPMAGTYLLELMNKPGGTTTKDVDPNDPRRESTPSST
jgi:hypothetical protein